MNGPVDTTFLDDKYNEPNEFDNIEEPIIRKKAAVDPFIWGLPKENPLETVKGKINGLEDLKEQLHR